MLDRAPILASVTDQVTSGRARWGHPRRMGRDEVTRPQAMRADGGSVRQIAMALGVPRSTVGRALASQNGWARRGELVHIRSATRAPLDSVTCFGTGTQPSTLSLAPPSPRVSDGDVRASSVSAARRPPFTAQHDAICAGLQEEDQTRQSGRGAEAPQVLSKATLPTP